MKPVNLRNVFFLTVLSTLSAIQLFLGSLWLGQFFGKPTLLAGKTFFESQKYLTSQFAAYWVIVFVAWVVVVLGLYFLINRSKLNDPQLIQNLQLYAWVETLLTFGLLCAAFKIAVYDDRPQLAQYAQVVLFCLAILSKVFWGSLKTGLIQIYQFLTASYNASVLKKIFFGLFIGVIFLIIYVPRPEPAVARMFFGEQFHHMDGVVVGSAWAFVSGCVLNIDIISRYGLGMPIVVGVLAKMFGGFNYVNILLVLVWIAIVYYVLWFMFLRNWFQSLMVAAITMLVALRVQLFHTGNYPFIFTYPSSTPLRYCFDIFFILVIYQHLKTHRPMYIWLAGLVCGFGIFYMTAEGVYLTLAYYFYLTVHLLAPQARGYFCKSLSDIPRLVAWFAFPFIVTFVFIYLAQGPHTFSREYWANMAEFSNFFLSGFGDFPIYQSLKSHLFLQSLMGFLYPVVYVLTFIIIGSFWFLRKIDYRDILVAVLCVYGMGLYHYYVVLSMWTSYYMNGLPFIFVCGYWLNFLVKYLRPEIRTKVLIGLLIASLYALVTNHNFISYPNYLNISRNPIVDPLVAQALPNRKPYFNHLFYEYPDAFKLPLNSLGEKDEGLRDEYSFKSDAEMLDYYRSQTDFSRDVALIQKYTSADDKVALLSSFEVLMLMQANRKPFFYYCPIVNSRPLRMRNYVVTAMYTVDHLKKTLNQLNNARPEYFFIERILLSPEVPQAYFYDSPGLFEILQYVFTNYEAVDNGQYLVALRRKDAIQKP